jgi:hypothetical protein
MYCINILVFNNFTIIFIFQVKCPENEHHSLSTLILATPEGCLKALLNDPFGSNVSYIVDIIKDISIYIAKSSILVLKERLKNTFMCFD